MYRPPPDYKWKKNVKAYEIKFRRNVPQWVFVLQLDDAAQLLNLCLHLNFKLSPKLLIAGESLYGYGGLWNSQKSYWDVTPKRPLKPKFIKD